VELVITIVIMAIVMVTIASTLARSVGRSADLLYQVKLVELGQAYLEEILTKRFDENSPVGGVPACSPTTTVCGAIGVEAGESRGLFDDVDDYDGLDESPPVDSQNNVRQNYAGYRVAVTVSYLTPALQSAYSLDGVTDGKLISVTVSPPTGTPLVVSVYKGNF